MVWVRIDDRYAENPKIVEAGPLCVALWLAGLAYCNRNLTDGFIPWSTARTLVDWEYAERDGRQITIAISCGIGGEDLTSNAVIKRLVEVGLWDVVRDGTEPKHLRVKGYQVHDYEQYQPSRAQVLKERELTAKRVSKFKERHKDSNAHGNAVSNAHGNGQVTAHPEPVPVNKRTKNIVGDVAPTLPLGNGNGHDGPKALVLFWANKFETCRGRPPVINWGKHMKVAKVLLSSHDMDTAKWMVEQLIEKPTDQAAERGWYDLSVLLGSTGNTILARRSS